MKRHGIHRPTVEDAVEISGIETLHPGGFALTQRTAEVTGLRPGLKVLDVSSGRGTQALYYAREFEVEVTGVDIAEDMIRTARDLALRAGLQDRVRFVQGDSQALPFADGTFDVVINECAVGIPDDSQKVLDEMLRVVKPGGQVAIHESTWLKPLASEEKNEISERYGTTPLEHGEWVSMLERAGTHEIRTELETWSKPENFWKVRKDRDVSGPGEVLTFKERLITIARILRGYGIAGIFKALENEKRFYRVILDGKLGYGLYWGQRPIS